MTEFRTEKEKIEKFLRFEIGWSEVGAGAQEDVIWDGECRITFSDVLNALYRMKDMHIGIVACDAEYITPLIRIADQVYLPDAIGYPGKKIREIDWNAALNRVPLDRESTLFSVIAYMYHEADTLANGEDRELDPDEWIAMMENTLDNEKLPMMDWKLSGIQQMHYVMYIHENDLEDYISEEERDLFGRCLDALCQQGIYAALRIQADCCAGGNLIYDCDWYYARDVYEILVQEQEDMYASMMLGRIYAQAKCEEEPDYDKAWKYSSAAALARRQDAMLDCADLMMHGYGILQNRSTALSLYREVYSLTKPLFADGDYGTVFADAAMRMGDCLRDGTGCDPDPLLAMSYYLDAENALQHRIHYMQRENDTNLLQQVQDKMDSLVSVYGALFSAKEDCRNEPFVLDRMLSGGYDLVMRLQKTADGYDLHLGRYGSGKILLTVEQMRCSLLQREFMIHVPAVEETDLLPDQDFMIDHVGYEQEKGTTIFWYQGVRMGYLVPDCYVFADERIEGWKSEESIKFAAVRFRDSMNTYDYICDLPDVKHGDHVAVDSRGQIAEAVVCWIFEEKMSRMPLPKERYKYVLQKMTSQVLS